jgi:hypothetical protein
VTCERCGGELATGAHGVGACPLEPQRVRHQRALAANVTWPGGRTFENLGNEPVTLYSPAELQREMKARGLEPFVRHVDGDRHVERWASVDLTDYHDPAVRRARQEAMAAHCGLTLEQYLERLGQPPQGILVEHEIEQAPVIERYIRSIDVAITGVTPRC